jgi:hypothetical protein
MTEQTFAQKTLDKLLEVVEIEFKIPLGIAEIKVPATDVAKRWWENEKSRLEVVNAIRRAEQNFIAAHSDNRLAQILHDFPLYSDEEYKNVILELLKHLDEEKIAWLAEVKIEHEWNKQISREDIRKALDLYIPYLRHELNGIKEYREIITARMLERIEQNTNETVHGIRRIESKLGRVLDSRVKEEPNYWYIPHPYPMPPNFTGRIAELKMLDDWLLDEKDRLFILRALGGFGKSALAWHWINTKVNSTEWPRLVWWSFYEGDASFEHFIQETLKYLKLEVPQGQRPQVDELLKAMQRQNILLIMDGFERALRAYNSMNAVYQGDEEPDLKDNQLDCVNINAEWFLKGVCAQPDIRSKVLMTTRMTPRVAKPRGEIALGCHEEELTSMQKADAVDFFLQQGVKGTRAEIEAACAPYGYHPLSLRLLAGHILKDFENPADVVVAQRLKIDGNLIQQKHHVLAISYNSLPHHEQKLLSMMACFRSSVELRTLEAIAENKGSLSNDLHDLVERGLLHFDEKNKKFDLHPIVRRYAYQHLTRLQRTSTHSRLCDYFASVDVPQKVQTLEALAPVIELYHHLVRAEKLDQARELLSERLMPNPLYFQFGAYELCMELSRALFINGEDNLPPLKDEKWQAWVINSLAVPTFMMGKARRSISLAKQSISIREKQGNKRSLAVALENLGQRQISIGALRDAELYLQRALLLYKETQSEKDETVAHLELGRLMSYLAFWNNAENEFAKSVELLEKLPDRQLQAFAWAYIGHSALLEHRDFSKPASPTPESIMKKAHRTLELIEEAARESRPVARYFVHAHWLLGVSYCLNGQHDLAATYLIDALTRCRAINVVIDESDILHDLARLRYEQEKYEEAKSIAEEALYITERCGYVLQGADINLFLAQYALEQEKDKAKAKEYAESALRLATCDGPPYYYKVAYEEAERKLEKLK